MHTQPSIMPLFSSLKRSWYNAAAKRASKSLKVTKPSKAASIHSARLNTPSVSSLTLSIYSECIFRRRPSLPDRSYVFLVHDNDLIEEDNETYGTKLRKHKALRRHTDTKMAAWLAMRRAFVPCMPETWEEYVAALRRLHIMFACYLECREARLAEAEAWLAVQQHLSTRRLAKDGSIRDRPMKKLLKAKEEVDRLRGRVDRGRIRLTRFEDVVASARWQRRTINEAMLEDLRKLSQLVDGGADEQKAWG